jgi:hypothetical protein
MARGQPSARQDGNYEPRLRLFTLISSGRAILLLVMHVHATVYHWPLFVLLEAVDRGSFVLVRHELGVAPLHTTVVQE